MKSIVKRALQVSRLVSVLLLGWLVASPALAAGYETETQSGRIEQMNIAQGNMIVGGLQYWTGADLRVEINGSFGAFTMLKEGMYIQMEFRIKPGNQRELYSVQEVMNPRLMEES